MLFLCYRIFLFKFKSNLKAFLTSKYGGRLFFGGGIGICSFLTLLMPLAAYFGPGGVIFIRILQGLAQVRLKNKSINLKT